MAIGPVQLLVLGFNDPDFRGAIVEELERLRESGAVRVIDSLAVFKDADGRARGPAPRTSRRGGGGAGASSAPSSVSASRARKTSSSAPRPSPATPSCCPRTTAGTSCRTSRTTPPRRCLLIEHHWAVPLREAIVRAGGFRISDGFISPLDLVGGRARDGRGGRGAARHRDRCRVMFARAGSLDGPDAGSPAVVLTLHALERRRGPSLLQRLGRGPVEIEGDAEPVARGRQPVRPARARRRPVLDVDRQ